MLNKVDIRRYRKQMREIESIKKPSEKIKELARLLLEVEEKVKRNG